MQYWVVWIVLLVLLAIWSSGVWVLHALLAWSLAGAGGLASQTQRLETLALPGWLVAWLPPEWLPALKAAASGLLPWLESMLSLLPGAAAWLSPLAWVVWGAGLLVLLAGAGIGLALMAAARRAARP